MIERSFLFVPGNRRERFDKACASGAHAVILDLEDAVAATDKATARGEIRAWLEAGGRAWLRINACDTRWHADDLALLALRGVAGVMLPKAEREDDVRAVAAHLQPGVPLMPLVESALGVWNAREVAAADAVSRLAFGSIDFLLDTGIVGDREELLYARSRLVLASRVAGRLPPVDGVTTALDDEAVLAADVAAARRLGFGGKLCIHPKQVATVNAGFRPSAGEVEWARRVVTAARARGLGESPQFAVAGDNAVRVDGKMVDKPVIQRAQALLDAERGG